MLIPTADGRLRSDHASPVAVMGPRLQAEIHPGGEMLLSLWGAGDLGRLRFTPMSAPFTYGPHGVDAADGALLAARSAPVLLLRGCGFRGFTPVRGSAKWDRAEAAVKRGTVQGAPAWFLPWATVAVATRDDALLIAAGADEDELRRGLTLSATAIEAEARSFADFCDRLPDAEPLLRSMVLAGTHAALANVREDAAGRFAGVSAGPAYSAPARTYYRDSYWTSPMLLQVAPDVVRAQIDLLAEGVQPDGEAPSGVLTAPPEEGAWARFRASSPEAARWGPREWWSDHFDSPLFFVLLVDDYVRATGDASPVAAHAQRIEAIFERYQRLGQPEDGLPLKPRHDRDWADNVFRDGLVAYDLGLWFGALQSVARLLRIQRPAIAMRAQKTADNAGPALRSALWRGAAGPIDYASTDGFTEDHLALDSLTLMRFGAVETGAGEMLAAIEKELEEPWGVRCCRPAYRRRSDLRSKSAWPGRYHNGADWPWLDGLYAEERLRRGLPGWRVPLLRWWETSLARGWTSPVEWFSPSWGRGSLLQGWSSLPAATALKHRERVLAGDQAGTG